MSRVNPKADTFLKLLLPEQNLLEAYCRRMLRNSSSVEDVLQSAVANAFAAFVRPEKVRHFKAWIFRFVTLEIFNANRQFEIVTLGEIPADLPIEESLDLVTQETTYAAMLEDPDVVLEHFDDLVVDALMQLAPMERATLLLRSIGEFSYREIHELLSIPLGSVIGYLSRARHRLRISLAEYAGERGWFGPGALSGGPES